jgi:hypothetical protein
MQAAVRGYAAPSGGSLFSLWSFLGACAPSYFYVARYAGFSGQVLVLGQSGPEPAGARAVYG